MISLEIQLDMKIRKRNNDPMAIKLTASEASRSFSEIMGKVRFQGETFLVMKHGKAVAMIKPAHEAILVQLRDLRGIMERAPHLTPADARKFEEDLEAGRSCLRDSEPPSWD